MSNDLTRGSRSGGGTPGPRDAQGRGPLSRSGDVTALSTDHLALTAPARTAPQDSRTGEPSPPDRSELDRLLEAGLLRTVTAPVVDLRTGTTVPLGSPATGPTGRPALPGAVLVDLTTPSRTGPPAELLRLADLVRGRGWGVALTATTATLALLPLVRPDVLTLDLQGLADGPAPQVAALVGAVGAQAERDGTTVLADGVRTPEQLRTALAAGATLGRGPFLPGTTPSDAAPAVRPAPRPAAPGSPFDLVAARRPVRSASASELHDVVHHLQLQALHAPGPCVVVATGPVGGTASAALLRQLSRGTASVTVVTADAAPVPTGAHRVDLPADDPWADEHVLAVVGPQVRGAVVARRTGTGFELAVTHDHDLVVDVVTRLLTRAPATTTGPAPAPDPAGPVTATGTPAPAGSPTTGTDELHTLLSEAIESDRRVGTATGLLLVGVGDPTGTTPAGSPTEEPGSPAAVVRRLRTGVRSLDRWIPLTDDLHAVLLTGLPRTGAEAVVDRVADALLHALESSPLTDPDTGARVSIGASLSPTRAGTADDAVAQARAALLAARAAGGHCARIRPV